MNIEDIRLYCLGKKGVTESLPFGDDVLVFKVMNKMFALVNLESVPSSVNLKCAPERCVELRERYEAVQPGYHQDKRRWNTVRFDPSIPDVEILEMVDDSYNLVVNGLRKKEKTELAAL